MQTEETEITPNDENPEMEIDNSFAQFGLSKPLMKAIKEMGYEAPSPIQTKTIPLLLAGKDIVGQAQTGTGKTAAFALPILEKIDLKSSKIQALVLAPTRELAIQVAEAFHTYSKHVGRIKVLPVYGGQSISQQMKHLRGGVQVVVGTPGRIMDHMRRETLDIADLKVVVLDEADEMLRMGFIDDVEWILGHTPETRQTALFSATMPREVRRIAERYLKDPVNVEIERKTLTVPTITQSYVNVSEGQKTDVLTRILEADSNAGEAVLIFHRTKIGAANLSEKLQARGYAAEAMHGDMSQSQRESVIKRLKNGQVEIVVATDVAARGLDVERIGTVINYDMPGDTEVYVHRIGRTGRAGREGKSILFVTPRQQRMKNDIERYTKQKIEPLKLPTKADIAARRVDLLKERIINTLTEQDLELYLSLVEEIQEENSLDIAEIAAACAFLAGGDKPLEVAKEPEFQQRSYNDDSRSYGNDNRSYNDNRSNNNERRPSRGNDEPRFQRGEKPAYNDEGMVRLFIDVGHNKAISPSDIVGAIANEGNIPGRAIGGIDIQDRFSLVDVPSEFVEQVLRQMQNTRLRGMNANIRLANQKDFGENSDAPSNEASYAKVFKPKKKVKGKSFEPKIRKKATKKREKTKSK
ncbi:MAG: DEAD/DEAH box helicase [Acidobacteriota bacterium]|nr:DEAD/DEAH box helicase [Acidobacteriota bacterium]